MKCRFAHSARKRAVDDHRSNRSSRIRSVLVRPMTCCLRSLTYSLRTLSCSLRTLTCSLRKLTCCLRTLTCSLRTLSCSLRTLTCSLRTLTCSLRTLTCSLRNLADCSCSPAKRCESAVLCRGCHFMIDIPTGGGGPDPNRRASAYRSTTIRPASRFSFSNLSELRPSSGGHQPRVVAAQSPRLRYSATLGNAAMVFATPTGLRRCST